MGQLTVVQLLPALESGGVERSTLEIAQALVAAGHRSIVISAGGRLVPELLAQGSEHIELALGRKSLATLRHVFTLRRLIKHLRPDIVHARSRLPAWLAWLALRLLPAARPAFVTTVHGLNSAGWYSGVMTRGDRIICVSDTVREHVLRQWPTTDPDKLEVIERGVDPRQFPQRPPASAAERAALAEEIPALAAEKLLLLPGRGSRLKGHAAAIRLLAALRQEGIDACLWLLGAREAGRDAYLAELEALAAEFEVQDFVAISPARAGIVDAYALSDLVLQLSERPEAFGRTVLEALAVGRPVLGWDRGGVGELLREHFPAGAVARDDMARLAATAQTLLQSSNALPNTLADSLAPMQARTLKVYAFLAR